MTYLLIAIAALLLGLIGYLVVARQKKNHNETAAPQTQPLHRSPQSQLHKLQANGRYWGFRVESHCRASSRLAGREYAFADRLPLPVEDCDTRICECCLIGLPERRQRVERRTGQDRRRSIRMDSSDRRSERPRRQKDRDSWVSYRHL